ncbi:MAG: type II toxin-antitoxin system VapB family antitoxin [Chloroflexi bacterium]|nr:type II toxin-antitoxin system VapB family antitoxin [Chloroflexota bacterium]
MARFSITVDPALVEEARQLAQAKTKREAIEQALREFIQRRRLTRLAELGGSGLVELDEADLRRWRESATPES